MSEGKPEEGRGSRREPADGGSAGRGPTRGESPGKGSDPEGRDGRSGEAGSPTDGPTRSRRSSASGTTPTTLTERQRREARELRRKRRGSSGKAGSSARSGVGNGLSRGLRATAVETGRALDFLWRGLRAALGRIGSLLLLLLGAVLTAIAAVATGIVRLAALIFGLASKAAVALDQILTPARAAVVVSALAAVMLGVSQFVDYRAVEIGGSGYGQILDLTRAPRTDVETPLGSHSVILLVAAIAALASCLALAVTGRRIFAVPVVAVGVITLAVGLAIDLPSGLDSEAASAAYADASPVLLSGFWLQMAAGAVLLAGGVIMSLRPSGERARGSRWTVGLSRKKTSERQRERAATGSTA
jgi:hypothetical protein